MPHGLIIVTLIKIDTLPVFYDVSVITMQTVTGCWYISVKNCDTPHTLINFVSFHFYLQAIFIILNSSAALLPVAMAIIFQPHVF
jgi:hypothetical protein